MTCDVSSMILDLAIIPFSDIQLTYILQSYSTYKTLLEVHKIHEVILY